MRQFTERPHKAKRQNVDRNVETEPLRLPNIQDIRRNSLKI